MARVLVAQVSRRFQTGRKLNACRLRRECAGNAQQRKDLATVIITLHVGSEGKEEAQEEATDEATSGTRHRESTCSHACNS